MVALHYPLHFIGIDAAWALARADAPQWLGVIAWLRLMEDHGEVVTEEVLVKHDPTQALAWLEKYASDATLAQGEKVNRFHDRNLEYLAQDVKNLRKKYQPGKLGNALPPLQPAEVFRHLDAPAELAVFGDRKKAEPGKVYVHQVLRAIQGL